MYLINTYVNYLMKIVFIQTGGSIDKDYPRLTKGYAFEIRSPAIKRILKNVDANLEFEILSVLKKDSLDITDKDREKIFNVCKKVKTDKIIITHGTDTMIKTAKKLSSIKNKTIILTGSMRPEKFYNSDAPFNIGVSVGAINVLKKGIYVSMNGRIYPWNKVKRDLKSGMFINK